MDEVPVIRRGDKLSLYSSAETQKRLKGATHMEVYCIQ